ncbi:hypothetical protein [Ochrobactrum soli]|uniref:Uncharacterized protein n=1 Tax=Ochrobactrum soli TaxID=2448455 RepID=A0A2P9HJX6_9HYPH|nr:hypothetical protein [[Ochrobactrum] soli]SPL64398.1 hypothetical protein OHAE_265 [[Ochrobactrum] soli]
MFGLLEYLKIGVGIVVGALVASFVAHSMGVSDGKKQASADALAATVKYYQDKGVIKDEVDTADAAALCADYGLPDDELPECVRRVREASAKPGNISDNSDR